MEFRATHPDVDGEARFPESAREHWEGIGWVEVDTAAVVGSQTIAAVLATVGDDSEKAAAALAAEQSRRKPRTTLVEALTAITAPDEGI